jgi:hypothetical protein
VFDGERAGHDGAAAAVHAGDNLQQFSPLIRRQTGRAAVVEDQQLNVRDFFQQPAVAAVTTVLGQCIEHARQALIEHGANIAAGLVCKRASQPTLNTATAKFQQLSDGSGK